MTMPVHHPLRRGALALLASLVLVAAAAPGAHAAGAGLNVGGNFFYSGPTYSAIAAANPSFVRFFLFWSEMEPQPGKYDQFALQAYDHAIASLAGRAKVLLVVVGSPPWANGGSTDTRTPPDPQAYAAFTGFLAGHFAGRVSAYEIWNEEDATTWWTGDVGRYATQLHLAHNAIKAADPAAKVVVGGLTGNDFHYLKALYAAGAKGNFDVVSDHTDTACNLNPPSSYFRDPDSAIDQFSFLGYRSVHEVMVANGDGNLPIWLTEMGWNTSHQVCDSGMFKGQKAGGVSESDQASYLAQAYHCLNQDPYVEYSFWFQLQDSAAPDTSQTRYGLLRPDGSRKPAFGAYSNYTHQGDQISGACGNFTGPRLSVLAPANNATWSGDLPIRVRATSPSGLIRIGLFYDAHKQIRNFTDRNAPTDLAGFIDWMGAKKLSPGKHTLSFEAYDKQGNKTVQTVTVSKVGKGGKAGEGKHARKVKGARRHRRRRHRKRKG